MAIEIGARAPDFTLSDGKGNTVSLGEFAGNKVVILAFYPLAFTGG